MYSVLDFEMMNLSQIEMMMKLSQTEMMNLSQTEMMMNLIQMRLEK